MDKTGYIEIRIKGKKGAVDLTPDNYDIKEIVAVLERAEELIFPMHKGPRPTISYRLEEGSVIHKFKTSLQAVIQFSALIGQIDARQTTQFLERPTAEAFNEFQNLAVKNDYTIEMTTSAESIDKAPVLRIDRNTQFYREEPTWVEAEFYFYGKVTNMGGKDKANFHIVTEEMGTVIVNTPKEFLEKYDANPLYKSYGIRATGKQNIETGEVDTSSLKFKEIITYEPVYDEEYLNRLRERAAKHWKDIEDPDAWLRSLRGSL